MKTRQTRHFLHALADFQEAQGCSQSALDLKLISTLFNDDTDRTLAEYTKTVKANWKSDKRKAAYSPQLREHVAGIILFLGAAEAAKQTKQFETFLTLFTGTAEKDSESFVHDVAVASIVRPQKATSSVLKKDIEKSKVNDYIKLLRMGKRSKNVFINMVQFENESPAIIKSVANQVIGGKHSTKPAALSAIERWIKEQNLIFHQDNSISKIRA